MLSFVVPLTPRPDLDGRVLVIKGCHEGLEPDKETSEWTKATKYWF